MRSKKSIALKLEGIYSAWLESLPDELRKTADGNMIIAGGAIASYLLDEEPNDFDMYCTDQDVLLELAKYYSSQFPGGRGFDCTKNDTNSGVKIKIQSAGVASAEKTNEDLDYQYFERLDPGDPRSQEFINNVTGAHKRQMDKKTDFQPVFISSNAISLSDGIQLITRFGGKPEEILASFDFAHTKNYWSSSTKQLYLDQDALESLLLKRLIYCGTAYPLSAIIRTRKFIKRGFHISGGEYLKMIFDVNALDLTDIKVLEDQLTGVDLTYFQTLILILRLKQEKEPNFMISAAYIYELIDRLF